MAPITVVLHSSTVNYLSIRIVRESLRELVCCGEIGLNMGTIAEELYPEFAGVKDGENLMSLLMKVFGKSLPDCLYGDKIESVRFSDGCSLIEITEWTVCEDYDSAYETILPYGVQNGELVTLNKNEIL